MLSFKSKIAGCLILSMLYVSTSCDKDDLNVDLQNSNVNIGTEQLEENRISFSKTLAKSLENVKVRELIKKEAAKRFNKDTEVLFNLIKNRNIDENTTLGDYMSAIHGSNEDFNRIIKSLPTLTILVPHLIDFDVEKWNSNSDVPIVASFPNKAYRRLKGLKSVRTFDRNLVEGNIPLKVYPNTPVLVVKDNERVVHITDVNNARIKNDVFFEGSEFQYSFVDQSFNNLNGKSASNARLDTYDKFDSRVKTAYENNLQYHRDYVYYNIAPELGLGTGSFNSNYAEFVTSIELVNSGVFGEIVDDPITDDNYPSFGDGDLEFIIKVFVLQGNSASELVSKWFDVPLTSLVTLNLIGNTWYYGATKHYVLPSPLEIAPWDMQRYGDQWKISVFEEDATTSQTIQYSVGLNSTFGTNYSNNVKDGPNFGSSSGSTSTYSSSYSFQLSGGHDYLYDAILRWDQKILFWDEAALPGAQPPFNQHWARASELNTGKIKLTIEPKLR